MSALQIAITLGILIFLFHDSAKRAQMAEALRRADWHWLLAGVFAYGAVEILGAIQWQLLLRIQGFRLPWLQATSIFFIGVFFTLFTPGLIAGDAVQILYLVKAKPERKAGAVLVVVMDRILGLLALVALAIVVAAARFHWLRRTLVAARLFDLTIILLALGLVSLIAAVPLQNPAGFRSSFQHCIWRTKSLRFATHFVAISLAEDGRHLLSALLSRRIFSTSAPFTAPGAHLRAKSWRERHRWENPFPSCRL